MPDKATVVPAKGENRAESRELGHYLLARSSNEFRVVMLQSPSMSFTPVVLR